MTARKLDNCGILYTEVTSDSVRKEERSQLTIVKSFVQHEQP